MAYEGYESYDVAWERAEKLGGVVEQIYLPDHPNADVSGNVYVIADRPFDNGHARILRQDGYWR